MVILMSTAKSGLFILGAMLCASCDPYAAGNKGEQESKNLIQDSRYSIIKEFFDNSDSAISKYRPVFSAQRMRPATKIEVSNQLVIAGQLLKYDPENRHIYLSFIRSELSNKDPDLEGMATSALYSDSSKETFSTLLEKLQNQHEIVRIEALGSLKYIVDSAQASGGEIVRVF